MGEIVIRRIPRCFVPSPEFIQLLSATVKILRKAKEWSEWGATLWKNMGILAFASYGFEVLVVMAPFTGIRYIDELNCSFFGIFYNQSND